MGGLYRPVVDIPGNAASADTAAACSGNAASADTAAACSGNAATATTAAECSGNAGTASAPQGGSALDRKTAKAWAVFNMGSGAPVLDDSANVGSFTDNAAGDVTVNYSVTMPARHVAVATACNAVGNTTNLSDPSMIDMGTTYVRFKFHTHATNGGTDADICCVAAFGG